MAVGIPNELFWDLTPREIEELLRRRTEEDRRQNLRAGLVAATVINVNKKKGTRMVQPGDFFRSLPRADDYMSVEEAQTFMDGWAAEQNGTQEVVTQSPIEQVIQG